MQNNIYAELDKLNDAELTFRLQSGYYEGDALDTCKKVLADRGVQIPSVSDNFYVETKPFYKQHPYITTLIVLIVTKAIMKAISTLTQSA